MTYHAVARIADSHIELTIKSKKRTIEDVVYELRVGEDELLLKGKEVLWLATTLSYPFGCRTLSLDDGHELKSQYVAGEMKIRLRTRRYSSKLSVSASRVPKMTSMMDDLYQAITYPFDEHSGDDLFTAVGVLCARNGLCEKTFEKFAVALDYDPELFDDSFEYGQRLSKHNPPQKYLSLLEPIARLTKFLI